MIEIATTIKELQRGLLILTIKTQTIASVQSLIVSKNRKSFKVCITEATFALFSIY